MNENDDSKNIEPDISQMLAAIEIRDRKMYEDACAWVEQGYATDRTLIPYSVSDSVRRRHWQKIAETARFLVGVSTAAGCNADTEPEFLNNPQVWQAGEYLNRVGGLALMQSVASKVPAYHHHYLEFAWDGIGSWKA